MRLRFWRTRDEKIAHLLQRLREAQQGAVRLKLGNAELARTNAKIQELFSKNVVDRRRLLGLLRVRGHELNAARAELELLRNVATKAKAWRAASADASAIGLDEHYTASWKAAEELRAAVDALPQGPHPT